MRFAQTLGGKVALLITYGSLFGVSVLSVESALFVTVILTGMTFWPNQRRHWLLAGTAAWVIWKHVPGWIRQVTKLDGVDQSVVSTTVYVALPIVVAFILSFGYLARRYRKAPVWNRPVMLLLGVEVAVLVVASERLASSAITTWLWAFFIVLSSFTWYFAYSLTRKTPTTVGGHVMEFGHYRPFWGGTATPFPKGADYLARIEARDAEQLAVCQIKGIKLLAWALVLQLLTMGVGHASGWLDIASMKSTLKVAHAGGTLSWHAVWPTVIVHFLTKLLALCVMGHGFISTVRMSGFLALRNTYKPLQSTTIAEFWNRYYYYFKEFLVDMFFYPAFFRHFKKHPRLRLFFATFSAACVGNIIFHFLDEPTEIAEHGLLGALGRMHVYVIYAVVLGIAIGASQARNKDRPPPRTWVARRLLAPAGVLLFYALMSIFNTPYRSVDIRDNCAVLLSLVGL